MTTIWSRQFTPEATAEQSAAAVLHRAVQRLEGLRWAAAWTLVVVGFVAVLTDELGSTPAVLGFIATWILTGFATPVLRHQLRRAVVAQEGFDTRVLGLPWNSGIAGERTSYAEIQRLARKLRPTGRLGRRVAAGWYDDTTLLTFPMDVLACQEQNAAWDLRLRVRYRNLVGLTLASLFLAGAILGYAERVALDQLILSFYVPALPAFAVGFETIANQVEVISQKRSLLALIGRAAERAEKEGAGSTKADLYRAREIQDGLFASRISAARVPHIVYRLFRDRDESDFESQVGTWVTKSR